MGVFFKTTYESRYAGNFENNVKQIKVSRYIINNLNNMVWQEAISNQLQKIDKHHTSLSVILRLFDIKDIEEGKLKSYARYKQKEDKLVIDQILVLNEYINFQEEEMRKKLCDDIFTYIEKNLKKYKNRFQNFDALAFIPLLEEQIKKIRNCEFEDNFYETESYAMLKQAEEIKKNIKNKLNS